ncbi:MAG: phage integrase N-terminal SAM-like domain-containing protein [Salinibacterium sp.]|nr:phage integrase N-terminal SAM-like domain-containing protein [Salinibacterium sp.]
MSNEIETRWLDAIERYTEARAAIASAATTAQYAKLIRAFAKTIRVAPWAVTPADVARWLDARGLARESRRSYRHALSSFYVFGIRAGLTDSNPVADSIASAPVKPSAEWDAAITEWARYERERGVAASTIAQRTKSLRKFANSTRPHPWLVTSDEIANWLTLAPSRSTRSGYESALRSFYRFAYAAKRIAFNPVTAPAERAQTLLASPAWEIELAGFRRAMRTEGKPETTIKLRLSQLRRFARENSTLEPYDVTLDALVDWMAGKRWLPATRRAQRSAFRSFYRWAKRTGRAPKNPASKLPTVRATTYVARPASDDALALALAKSDRRDRMALVLAAELGMRCAEVARVHSDDVRRDRDGRASLVIHGKGGRRRVLPITEDLAGRLGGCGLGYIFPGSTDGHLSSAYLGKRLSALLPDGVTMHMLRHRFATRAYAVDRDVFTVQRLLGHASPATTQGYVNVSEENMRRLVEAVAS